MKDPRGAFLAALVWGAALLAVFAPEFAGGMLALCLAGALGLGVFARRRGMVVLVLLACAAVSWSVVAAGPARAEAARWDGRAVETVVQVTSSAVRGDDGRLWADAQTLTLGAPGAPRATAVPVRIGVEEIDGVDLGATLRLTGQAKATGAGERAALVIFGTRVELERPASGVFALAADARAGFVERATRLPGPGAGLLPGLAVGDTTAVTAELDAAMLASGLSHLTAVSGANCAIVVAAVFWVVSLCGGSRWLRVTVALVALAAFVVLVTPEPSVIRASVMAALAMLTILLGRPSAGLAMLSLAVTGILVIDPWLAATPGFALSAAATGALLLLARPLMRGMTRWMPAVLALAISVPLAAQLVCGPIVALFSEQQSLVSVAANLLAAPAAPLATVIGLLACLSAPIPPLADLLAAAAWLPSAWIASVAEVSAALPGAVLPVTAGLLSAAVVGVLSAAVGIVLARPPSRALRRAAAAVLVVAAGLAGARMLLTGPLAAAGSPEGWSIAACDIGQGDAMVVRSEGIVALIDTGPDPGLLDACLRALGIDHIDLLVLTHFDLDHVGGVDAVQGRAETVLHGPVSEGDEERLLEMLADGGARLVQASRGMYGNLGGANWRVLWPRADDRVYPAGNDASVVLDISGGGVPRSLFLGDLAAEPQRQLVRDGSLLGDFDVVKVSHHGSGDQDAGLYELLGAEAAVIGVGADNDYGHPRAETLALLETAGSHVLRTDQRGRILLSLRDGQLAVWSERMPE